MQIADHLSRSLDADLLLEAWLLRVLRDAVQEPQATEVPVREEARGREEVRGPLEAEEEEW
jgi:hypothetical protein